MNVQRGNWSWSGIEQDISPHLSCNRQWLHQQANSLLKNCLLIHIATAVIHIFAKLPRNINFSLLYFVSSLVFSYLLYPVLVLEAWFSTDLLLPFLLCPFHTFLHLTSILPFQLPLSLTTNTVPILDFLAWWASQ